MRPYIMYVIGYKHIPVISILFSGPEGMLITGMQCTTVQLASMLYSSCLGRGERGRGIQ